MMPKSSYSVWENILPKVSQPFHEIMDSLVINKDDIKVITNRDQSRTATYGTWILVRIYKDGRVKQIMSDAPRPMMIHAYEALGLDGRDA